MIFQSLNAQIGKCGQNCRYFYFLVQMYLKIRKDYNIFTFYFFAKFLSIFYSNSTIEMRNKFRIQFGARESSLAYTTNAVQRSGKNHRPDCEIQREAIHRPQSYSSHLRCGHRAVCQNRRVFVLGFDSWQADDS